MTGGTVEFKGKDLLELSPEDRAGEGIFMAFQYPVEIHGVSNQFSCKRHLMRCVVIAVRKRSTALIFRI